MKVRFLADNDLGRSIIHRLLRRLPAIDFRHTPLEAMSDVAVLAVAAEEGRVLVSHDIRTMPAAFAGFRRQAHSPGVLLVPQNTPAAVAVEQLALVWELPEASEWEDRICYLPTLADFLS